jgi:hypothetical protein
MTGRQLRKLFADFNGQYFGGRLPEYRIHVGRIASSGLCNRRRRVITIAPGPDQTQRDTLVHEMAHAATKCGHSPKFFAELGRLKALGLAITNQAMEAMAAGCRVGYADVVRQINGDYGYADSVSAFDRRYPWAKGAFAEAKKEFTIYQKQIEALKKIITEKRVQG